MFINLCLFTCLVACVYGLQRGALEKYGAFNGILNSRVIKCVQNRNLNLDVSGIKVHFFDFSKDIHKEFPIDMAAEGILSVNDLDRSKKFVMFVGGFTSHINHSVEQQMRVAYKTYPNSYLIIPDHSRYTNDTSEGNIKSYERSVTYVHYIGKALGEMWAQIKAGGVASTNIHCVGHSLGGQILGHVGESFFNVTGEKILRISALDPAGPCFTKSDVRDQVRSGVAEYVEVYHSNAGALGSSSVLADVDYFINNGETQSTCSAPYIPSLWLSSKAASCSHRVVIDVWTTSVKNQDMFLAHSCDSHSSLQSEQCSGTVAGAWGPATAKGIYYINTEAYDLMKMR